MAVRIMPGNFPAVGDDNILNIMEEVFQKQIDLDRVSTYHPGDKVKVCASLEDLINLFLASNNVRSKARQEALLVLSDPIGTVVGATKIVKENREETWYTIETSIFPMLFLPENFLKCTDR